MGCKNMDDGVAQAARSRSSVGGSLHLPSSYSPDQPFRSAKARQLFAVDRQRDRRLKRSAPPYHHLPSILHSASGGGRYSSITPIANLLSRSRPGSRPKYSITILFYIAFFSFSINI